MANKYKVLDRLGSGAFGAVYLVEDESGGQFAQKRLEPGTTAAAAIAAGHLDWAHLVRRFKREVVGQSKVAHRNVIRIVDYDLDANPPWFVMERAETTLAEDIPNLLADPASLRSALFDVLAGLEAT